MYPCFDLSPKYCLSSFPYLDTYYFRWNMFNVFFPLVRSAFNRPSGSGLREELIDRGGPALELETVTGQGRTVGAGAPVLELSAGSVWGRHRRGRTCERERVGADGRREQQRGGADRRHPPRTGPRRGGWLCC